MLIHSKEKYRGGKIIAVITLIVILLVLLKILAQSNSKIFDSASTEKDEQKVINTPTVLNSLVAKEQISNKTNEIYNSDTFSLYLLDHFGVPYLLIDYPKELSTQQRTGGFYVFLFLKDPYDWKKVNKRHDHIILHKKSLTPFEIEIADEKHSVFKFPLTHSHFDFENLKAIEFVRQTEVTGRFEEAKITVHPDLLIKQKTTALSTLQIALKSKDLTKITSKRNKALESGILVTNDDDFVKADISTLEQKNINAEIRLKGDWTDHLEHPTKWSYRIVPDGEETVFRMRKFSVQHPKSRNYIWEWLFNKVVKDNGLVGLRYEFLDVQMNIIDKDSVVPMGIMAMEESFDKILIENNKRREGLILGFDESKLWDERKQVRDLLLTYPKDADVPNTKELPIKVYNQNKTLSSPVLKKQFITAKNLLVGLRDEKLNLSDAFDIDKLTLYIALSNLFGGHHGLHMENIRLYYNPVINKLEPVSFDSNSGYEVTSLREYPVGVHDPLFTQKLVENYEKVSSTKFIDSFLNKYKKELNSLYHNLSTEFEDAKLDLSVLEHNANLIKKKIRPNTPIDISFISKDDKGISVEVKNFSEFPVVINNLILSNKKSLNQKKQNIIVQPKDTATVGFSLKKSFNNAFVSKKNKEGGFRYPKDLDKIQITHHILGSSYTYRSAIVAFPSNLDEEVINKTKLTENYNEFDFVLFDEKNKSITFKSGHFVLDRVIVIPPQHHVTVEKGFSLDLRNQGSILSDSPFTCVGTEEEPIQFYSRDGTGGGILISSATDSSTISHTSFKNLSVPSLKYWELSGSVNFNETHVDINNCLFADNRSEDALNIINSTFTLDSSTFENTFSDSFDGDFVKGSISNSTFNNSGNDGIDVSGSTIALKNIVINNPSDKGLSAGEGSTMTGNSVTINGGEIGVVSKDLSEIDLSEIAIKNTRLAIACFQKKSEYGPGKIVLKNILFSENEVAHLIAPESVFILDNIPVEEKVEGVIDKMYGNEYGKSSR
ncbi:hypothetical protein [Pseudozobellia sp. WGM2]|uniref:hypothetical protein n=1 Tax=Pseudozobellia sp. WGM2 TaxID=2787625 RepID=UPI001ADF1B03|nr:hypothetical protein [Pseudozobellia sp. WGM2]